MVKTINIGKKSFVQPSDNISLLQETAENYKTGKLEVSNSVSIWSFFWEDGYLFYAFSWAESRHLFHRKIEEISPGNPVIQAKLAQVTVPNLWKYQPGDTGVSASGIDEQYYLLICWLLEQQYLSMLQVQNLITEIAQKAINSFFSIREGRLEFIPNPLMNNMPKFCHLDLTDIYTRENSWSLRPKKIDVEQNRKNNFVLSPGSQKETLIVDAIGAKLIEQEINLENVINYYEQGNSVTTKTTENSLFLTSPAKYPQVLQPSADNFHQQVKSKPDLDQKIYKILCIDDSPMILKTIRGYLDEQIFQVIVIDDSLKALVDILRHKPDVILLDISMPNLDGYELCSLLRKHPKHQNTPIIMVTGRTGLIDKARAKLVKASGYLNKPFSKVELLKIIFQNLAKIDK